MRKQPKNLILTIAAAILISTFGLAEQPVTDTTLHEQKVTVFALSGLKLRLAPATNAEVITVIDFGEELSLLKKLNDTLYRPPSVEWTEGSWALVNYDGMTGYIYDGFVNPLPLPTGRLTNAQFSLTAVLDEYVHTHLGEAYPADTVNYHVIQDNNYHVKYKHYLNGGIRYDKHVYLEKSKGKLTIPNVRITDAFHVVRALLLGFDKGEEILNGILFKQDHEGNIYEISDRFRKNLIIKSYDGQNVSIVVQDFAELGC